MLEIESAQNPKYRRWLSLLESKGIKKEGLAILSGEKLVRELLEQDPSRVADILVGPKMEHPKATYRLASPLFRELDVIGTKAPLAVVRAPSLPAWEPAPPRGLELVVAMSDPSNLGAILRSALAFGASRVILARESASPYLPKALKAASLATFRLEIAVAGSLEELTLEHAYGLDMEGENIRDFSWPRDLYLVVGEEGRGLPSGLALKRLKIPMNEGVESLNATVAASLALYAYRSQFNSLST